MSNMNFIYERVNSQTDVILAVEFRLKLKRKETWRIFYYFFFNR